MDTGNVDEVVMKRFATIMNLPLQGLDLNANLAAEYGITSLGALKLISEVEVEFDIDIEEDEARTIQTLKDVVELIKGKVT